MAENDGRQRLTLIFAYGFSGMYAASWAIDAFSDDYSPPPTLGAIVLIIAGALFAEGVLPRRRSQNRDQESDRE